MKHAFLVLALLSASSITVAEAAAKFEGAMLPNGSKSNPAFFRIEVATGKVVSVWGYGTTQFTAATEKASLPAGEYHLFAVSDPQADGTVLWSMDRLEANTGRTWNLIGGGNDPFTWVEVSEPK